MRFDRTGCSQLRQHRPGPVRGALTLLVVGESGVLRVPLCEFRLWDCSHHYGVAYWQIASFFSTQSAFASHSPHSAAVAKQRI